MKKKCILYVGVSTEEQTKGYSLDAQEDEGTTFTKQKGYEVIKIFREEGLSAKNFKRHGRRLCCFRQIFSRMQRHVSICYGM